MDIAGSFQRMNSFNQLIYAIVGVAIVFMLFQHRDTDEDVHSQLMTCQSNHQTCQDEKAELLRIKWKHANAVAKLNEFTEKYGEPSMLARSAGGAAVWNKSALGNTCFHKLMVKDESVPHCVPLPHHDMVYHFIHYDVDPQVLPDVLSLSGSVSYDPLKKLLRARCDYEEANIATLFLATEIASRRLSVNDVRDKKLYTEAIMSIKNPEAVKVMYDKLCNNVKHESGDLSVTGYWPQAFPEGCGSA